MELFDQRRTKRDPDPATITLGWIGSPSTLHNLYLIWEPLEKLFARHDNLHLRLVGTGPDFSKFLPPFERVRFSCRSRYGQAEMIEEVLKMDVGLFPLQDVEASRTRGVLKATVYMSGGAAVVCSPIGQCVDLIQEGVNGFLAATPEEWVRKIERLVESTALRQTVARNGLEQVRREFTVEKSFDKLIAVLDPDRAASP